MAEEASSKKVIVHHKMVGMPVFDGQFSCDVDLELYAVSQKIIESHGGTTTCGFRMWLTRVEPGLIVRDFKQNLFEAFSLKHESVSSMSRADGEMAYHVVVYYDYDAPQTTCPLLKLHLGDYNPKKHGKN
ncbi:hypothetical protein TcG_01086 [Trypanosoma cruzi]|uniref:Uncharacterized protein n=1 Tax=Trypanosoma cruzi TaxID=5693 RepID=A0A2V2UQY4_TRYCR|nr:hypothetical protein TcBrA4_0085500 [Trypanosoma cruzi]PBJ70208.1 hypothetical protein BCY84_18619 [Trypanosoma cruzi cruzi]PWU84703.1 hypothetical protein C4B63_207g24c [Trypanosoma cruzi]RNF23989.1 hypothetical protein TcG_01086 [Trypanosoma cruzi]